MPRAETTTSCDVHICISLDPVAGHYEVVDVILDHNHGVYLPETLHLMLSQRKISDFKLLKLRLPMIPELGQKLHMNWLVAQLEDG
jgi:hypothetical protein